MANNDYMSTQEVLTGIKTWVKKEIGTNIYDISANHNGAKYANLSAALGTNGANIPQSLRKGGMSVKFVQSSDNKYMQYRLMSDSFNTTPSNWQGVDDEPTAGSDNTVKSGGVKIEANDIRYKTGLSNIVMGIIINSSNEWDTNTGVGAVLIKVKEGDSINVKATSIYYAFLTDDDIQIGETASGIRTYAQNSISLTVPEGKSFLYLYYAPNNSNYKFKNVSINGIQYFDEQLNEITNIKRIEDLTVTAKKLKSDVENTQKEIDAIYGVSSYDDYFIANGVWERNIGVASFYLYKINKGSSIRIEANKIYYTLLKSFNGAVLGEVPEFATNYSDRIYKENSVNIIASEDAAYLYLFKNKTNTSYDVTSLIIDGMDYTNRDIIDQIITIGQGLPELKLSYKSIASKNSLIECSPINIKSVPSVFDSHYRFIKYKILKGCNYKITLVPFSDNASNFYATMNTLYVSKGGVPVESIDEAKDDRLQLIFDGVSFTADRSIIFTATQEGEGLQLYSNFAVTLKIENVTYGDNLVYDKYSYPIIRIGAVDKYNVFKDLNKDIYDDYAQVRIPNTLVLNNGNILAFGFSPIFISKSIDGGNSFVINTDASAANVFGQSVCYDMINNVIFAADLSSGSIAKSTDNGETFSVTENVFDATSVLAETLTSLQEEEAAEAAEAIAHGENPQRYYYVLWTELTGPGIGIQLTNGVLAFPCYATILKMNAQLADAEWEGDVNAQGYMMRDGYPYRRDINAADANKQDSVSVDYILYSKDYGETWIKSPTTPADIYVNELSIAEVEENQIMINARGGSEAFRAMTRYGRRIFVPTNSQTGVAKEDFTIEGWELEPVSDGKLWDPLCHASFSRVDYYGHTFWLFCNPYINGLEEYNPRSNLMLQVSADAKHWSKVGLVSPYGRFVDGYCSIHSNGNKISFVYEGHTESDRGIFFVDISEYLIEKVLSTYLMNKKIFNID